MEVKGDMYSRKKCEQLIEQGVIIDDVDTTYIDEESSVEKGTRIRMLPGRAPGFFQLLPSRRSRSPIPSKNSALCWSQS